MGGAPRPPGFSSSSVTPFEHFAHTADLGLRVEGADLDALFRDAARGLMAMVVEEVPADSPMTSRSFSIESDSLEYLLFDWLNGLLYVFETEHLLMRDFDVRVSGHRLEATASTLAVDRSRHRLLHEVKAITYHGLRVERVADGWLAEVIVDI